MFGNLNLNKLKNILLIICFLICSFFVTYFLCTCSKKKENLIEIYMAYHKVTPIYENEFVIPIHAGRSLRTKYGLALRELMIGDNTGKNISHLNDRYSELTVLYWMWKNSKADIVGLMHYRRWFKFANVDNAGDDYFKSIGYTREIIEENLRNYDVLVPYTWGLDRGRNIYEHYLYHHYIEDFYTVLQYIRKRYPEMKNDLNKWLLRNRYFPCNMFIAKKEVIDEYAKWLFDILFAVDADINYDHSILDKGYRASPNKYDYQKRAPSFMSERLFDFWLYYNRDKYKTKEIHLIERKNL